MDIIFCDEDKGREKKCVWMTSGLISYKLCPYDYLCEECIFDKAMRNEANSEPVYRFEDHIRTHASGNIHQEMSSTEDYFFHPNHCWARVENSDCVRIGIDGLLARFIIKIKTIVLPQIGETVSRGLCFSHIIQQKYILPLVSPLTGSILSVNNSIEKSPELLLCDFQDKGWLITIKPKNLEADLRTLIFGKKAAEWYRQKEREILKVTNTMLNSSAEALGPTIQDGGEIISNIVDSLNSEQYYQILESLSQGEDLI